MWLALKRIECSGVRVVVWREVEDVTDYYATTELSRHGTWPRVRGKFIYDDATGETSLNGQRCKDVQ
jgi:hypothetical protein